jgi:alkanesulfonate monooxygenase SsuD/methylene tetrahydromethanopterin reductase-like flavin-dependent oxidoreductase (luciferase family)
MGLPYDSTRERQEALEEALAIIQGVWGSQTFSFTGRHYRASDARFLAQFRNRRRSSLRAPVSAPWRK